MRSTQAQAKRHHLVCALRRRDPKAAGMFEALLAACPAGWVAGFRDSAGFTLLMRAAAEWKLGACRALLMAGCDVNAQLGSGEAETVNIEGEESEDTDNEDEDEDCAGYNADGSTALILACASTQLRSATKAATETVGLLLQCGARADIQTADGAMTALACGGRWH